MITVYVKKQSNYSLSSPKLKKHIRNFFEKRGIVSNADVSVTFVSDTKMIELARKYLGEKDTIHNVLTFANLATGKDFIYPPDSTLHLGDIVVCYPKVLEEAKKEGKMIDAKVIELAEHGALHLLGEHHE